MTRYFPFNLNCPECGEKCLGHEYPAELATTRIQPVTGRDLGDEDQGGEE